MENLPLVSIIIPVYQDTERLVKCIEALQKQTYPKNLLDIIIVNNDSGFDIKDILNDYKNISLLQESSPGSYSARNKGILFSKGSIIAFTDSDCIPSEQWIECGVKGLLSNPNIGIVGGAVNLFFRNKFPSTVELYDSLFFLQQKRYIREYKIAVTANLFTFKDIFYKIGLYDNNLKSGADGEWCKRVVTCGYEIIYSDSASVRHPARFKLGDLYEKIRRVTGGKFVRDNRIEEKTLLFWIINFKEISFGLKRVLKLEDVNLNEKIRLFLLETSIQMLRGYELLMLRYGKDTERK
ncbi:MAG: glycosyltransferase [bacterium]|nr:glycosyltransferase [bacterium]